MAARVQELAAQTNPNLSRQREVGVVFVCTFSKCVCMYVVMYVCMYVCIYVCRKYMYVSI